MTATMLLQHVSVSSCPEDLMRVFSPVRWALLAELLAGKQSCAVSTEHVTALSPFPFTSTALQNSRIITKMFE